MLTFFFLGNINTYLHFIWFLNTEIMPVVHVYFRGEKSVPINLVNIIANDDLAKPGTRSSTSMISIYHPVYDTWNKSGHTKKGTKTDVFYN